MARLGQASIENAKLIFKNFSGKGGDYNNEGDRNFCILLDPETAEAMAADGWSVKQLKPRNDEDPVEYMIKVKVKYGQYPPNIWLITRRNKVLLTEQTVNQLDVAEIANVDVVLSPYSWERGGQSGVTAYVKNMYVTIVEDEFASKYEFPQD